MMAALLPEPAATELAPTAAVEDDVETAVDEETAREVAPALDDREDAETDAAAAPTAAATSLPDPTPPAPTEMPTEASTAIATAAPTLDLPAEGLQGAQNLLELFGSAAAQPILAESAFRRQNGSWRLGSAGVTEGETLFLLPAGGLAREQLRQPGGEPHQPRPSRNHAAKHESGRRSHLLRHRLPQRRRRRNSRHPSPADRPAGDQPGALSRRRSGLRQPALGEQCHRAAAAGARRRQRGGQRLFQRRAGRRCHGLRAGRYRRSCQSSSSRTAAWSSAFRPGM